MTRAQLLEFLRAHRYAVQASVSPAGRPQAAVVGVIVSDRFEIFFDTLAETRKARNLRHNAGIAFVFGGTQPDAERTAQVEGVTDEPGGTELERLKDQYLARFPDGVERQQWPGLIYIRARPTWIRYSDFRSVPPTIVEFSVEELEGP
jgi:general stress protein 26